MTETPETAETPETQNNKAFELAGELVSIIQNDKLNDQEKVEKVKNFIEENKDNNLYLNVKGVADGRTVLHYAAEYGTDEMVNTLIDAGAVVDAKDNYGWTPLMCAARYGTPENVKALIAKGADVNAKDEHGNTVLMCAARNGTHENVEVLITAGADVHAKDRKGWTPLMHAALYGTPETVKALIRAGADVKATDKFGKTALDIVRDELNKDYLKGKGPARTGLEKNQEILRDPNSVSIARERPSETTPEPAPTATNGDTAGKTGAEPKDGKGDKDGEPKPTTSEPTNAQPTPDAKPKDGDPKGKPAGKKAPAPSRSAPSRPAGVRPSGEPKPTTTERPPEAQGPNATPEATPTQPTTREPQGQASESTGVLSWIRNSMFGRFFGLDDESVAKRAQSAAQLAQYGQEGGGWFRNSLLGRWLGLDDQTKLKELAQTQPAQPQNATVRAAYSGGNAVQDRPVGAAARLGGHAGGDLTQERRPVSPERGVSRGRGRQD